MHPKRIFPGSLIFAFQLLVELIELENYNLKIHILGDKYYACNDNQLTEKLCPDGMVFNDYSPDQEKCDLPLNIDCSKRPKLRKLKCPIENEF